ncbi:DUF3986 family protein [Micromonospora provocatoris]
MKKQIYKENLHFHVGYYENNFNIETIGYKIKHSNEWVFFIESSSQISKNLVNKYELFSDLGFLIFSMHITDLTHNLAYQKFIDWLISNRII